MERIFQMKCETCTFVYKSNAFADGTKIRIPCDSKKISNSELLCRHLLHKLNRKWRMKSGDTSDILPQSK